MPKVKRGSNDVSLQRRLQEADLTPEARSALGVASFMGSDLIPAHWLGDPETISETIALLRLLNLIGGTSEKVSLSRPVRDSIRDRLSPEERDRFGAAAIDIVSAALFPSIQGSAPLSHDSAVMVHATTVMDHAVRYGFAPGETAALISQLGILWRIDGNSDQALSALKCALAMDLNTFGILHETVVRDLINLGDLHRERGELKSAREAFVSAVKTVEDGEPNAKYMAMAHHNLGAVLYEMGSFVGARREWDRTLEIDEDALGLDHHDVGRDLSNLGTVLISLGEPAAALERLTRSLPILESHYGPDHARVGTTLCNLAGANQKSGNLDAAREHLERALRIMEAAFGDTDRNTARILTDLGDVLADQGDLSGARALVERGVRIYRATLGTAHRTTYSAMLDLYAIHESAGDADLARTTFTEAADTLVEIHRLEGSRAPAQTAREELAEMAKSAARPS